MRAYFNPRSPHGERHWFCVCFTSREQFQSTLPARGATCAMSDIIAESLKFQSTLPARGATATCPGFTPPPTRFQSTLPARGATILKAYCEKHNVFQSTLPARGATDEEGEVVATFSISIHAPRTGSDNVAAKVSRQSDPHFNPRSPHGERPLPPSESAQRVPISIHAPRTGSDSAVPMVSTTVSAFQSTLPARGATRAAHHVQQPVQFQSTLPARGATNT